MRTFTMLNPTKVYFGVDSVSNLGKELKRLGHRVLLVYGCGSIRRNGIYSQVVEEIEGAELELLEFGGISPNPTLAMVNEGAGICREQKCDVILAVGGGSVIDCAKAIAAAALYEDDFWAMMTAGQKEVQALPVAVVLTNSAAGSEMNDGVVITNEDLHEKCIWGNEALFPKVSILDPNYTFTVSKRRTACGIVDILSHLFEFYFTGDEEDFISDRMSEAAMASVIRSGKIAIMEPDNYEARANLMWASSLALNGYINRAKTYEGVSHAIELALSNYYDITHAEGLAVLIPIWMTYALDGRTASKLARFARTVWGIREDDDMVAAQKGIERTKRYFEFLDMPTHLDQLNIDDSHFRDVIDAIFKDEHLGSFKELSRKDVFKILDRAI